MTSLALKDKVILGHVYLYSGAMTYFMFRHPEAAPVIAPVVASLLGMAHWFVIFDDKRADA